MCVVLVCWTQWTNCTDISYFSSKFHWPNNRYWFKDQYHNSNLNWRFNWRTVGMSTTVSRGDLLVSFFLLHEPLNIPPTLCSWEQSISVSLCKLSLCESYFDPTNFKSSLSSSSEWLCQPSQQAHLSWTLCLDSLWHEWDLQLRTELGEIAEIP